MRIRKTLIFLCFALAASGAFFNAACNRQEDYSRLSKRMHLYSRDLWKSIIIKESGSPSKNEESFIAWVKANYVSVVPTSVLTRDRIRRISVSKSIELWASAALSEKRSELGQIAIVIEFGDSATNPEIAGVSFLGEFIVNEGVKGMRSSGLVAVYKNE